MELTSEQIIKQTYLGSISIPDLPSQWNIIDESPAQYPEPSDPFRILSRHDSNNLEVKLDFNWPNHSGTESSSMEFACVLPNNISLKGFSKTDLWTDFRSRTRLLVQMEQLLLNGRTGFQANAEALSRILEASVRAEYKDILTAVQGFGYQACEYLKKKNEIANKSLFMIYSLLNTSKDSNALFESVVAEIRHTAGEIEKIRSVLSKLRTVEGALYSDCAEYIHFQYIRYLSSISAELEKHKDNPRHQGKPDFAEGNSSIQKTLAELCEAENLYLKESAIRNRNESPIAESEYLIKMGTLKRFFHSGTFVDAAREEYIKRFSEPLASGAALFAACLGAAVQRVSEPGILNFGAGGVGLISLGIFIYVFRDRMKDKGRSYFTEWLGKKIPEVRDSLLYKGKKVGVARKWLQVRRVDKLSKDMITLKSRFDFTKLESENAADVLWYKESFALSEQRPFHSPGSTQHLHHILRINLRRFLKFMDDSCKDVSFLSQDGKLQTRQVARLYPFIIFVRKESQHSNISKAESELFAYRALVSKDGIQSVEPILDSEPKSLGHS